MSRFRTYKRKPVPPGWSPYPMFCPTCGADRSQRHIRRRNGRFYIRRSGLRVYRGCRDQWHQTPQWPEHKTAPASMTTEVNRRVDTTSAQQERSQKHRDRQGKERR